MTVCLLTQNSEKSVINSIDAEPRKKCLLSFMVKNSNFNFFFMMVKCLFPSSCVLPVVIILTSFVSSVDKISILPVGPCFLLVAGVGNSCFQTLWESANYCLQDHWKWQLANWLLCSDWRIYNCSCCFSLFQKLLRRQRQQERLAEKKQAKKVQQVLITFQGAGLTQQWISQWNILLFWKWFKESLPLLFQVLHLCQGSVVWEINLGCLQWGIWGKDNGQLEGKNWRGRNHCEWGDSEGRLQTEG